MAALAGLLLGTAGGIATQPVANTERPLRVVAWGDSITYGGGTADPEAQSWPALIGAIKAATPRGCLVVSPCMGRFRVGLDVFDKMVLSHRPDVVVIAYGTNDLAAGATAETVVQAYREIVQRARAAGVKPLVVGITPTTMYYNEARAETNRLLQREFPRQFVDLEAFLVDPKTGMLAPRYNSGDGVHPNAAAYRVMAREIRHAIWPAGCAR